MADLAPPIILDDGYIRKKWTVDECRKLVQSELLTPGKFELIEGDIVFKMGRGRDHIAAVILLMKALIRIFTIDHLQCQAEIGIGEIDEHNDPEPDIAVLKQPVNSYRGRQPDPQTDVLLAVEAAVTSLQGDSTTKAQIYARSGICEYWVLADQRRQLIVHRIPTPQGYADVRSYNEDEYVSPLSAPNEKILVGDLLA